MYTKYFDNTGAAEYNTGVSMGEPRSSQKSSAHRISYNGYEKKAERIRQEAHREILPAPKEERKASKSIGGFQNDDILLGILIFFLVKEEKADMMLIMALVFILLN
ncbi:MAG: hypothetical protein IJT38_06135 [Clostridia bacterium]|nr:hypothetical protein [Clostridia bacterium]